MKEGWIEVELGKVAIVNMGQSPPSSTYNSEGKGLPFFQGKAEFTSLYPIEKKWCTEPKKIATKGEILMSVRAPVGSVNLANKECAIGRGLAAINWPYQNLYLWYYLQSIKQLLDKQGTGTTFKAISGTVLKSQILPLPPLPEQRAIVAKIERLFSELDHGVAQLNKVQAQLKVYKQAVLKKAFEGEFKYEKLKNLTSKIGSGSTPRGGKSSYQSEGIPLVRSLNIHSEFIKYKDLAFINEQQAEKLSNVIIEKGDVLLNITGASIGRVNIAPKDFEKGRVNQHVSILRPNENLLTKFLKFYIQSPHIQDWIFNENYGVTRQALTKTSQENMKIPLPSLKQQTLIVQEIESRFSVVEQLEKELKENLQKSASLRQSILKQAFEGRLLSEAEIKACKKEKDWEPASELLGRIGKETNN